MSTLNSKVLAGVRVIDTPLVNKAIDYARKHCNEITYNHVMRSWLIGTFIADQLPLLQARDKEVHAIATILHDLGWAETPELISTDKRFEVDGADAARAFLLKEGDAADWDHHRLQLVWDSIALHGTPNIAAYKEIEVQSCTFGIEADFSGPDNAAGGVLTREVWNAILEEFPREGFKQGIIEKLCGLCETKPSTTYNNWAGDFGDVFVSGYTRDGNRGVDGIIAMEE